MFFRCVSIDYFVSRLGFEIVLLTKLDKICPYVNDDITNTFTSSAVCNVVEKVADIMGLPRGHVLPVKNYENEATQITGVNILLMEALERCLDFADDFLDEQLDSVRGKVNVFSKVKKLLPHAHGTKHDNFHFLCKMLVCNINKKKCFCISSYIPV